MAEDALSVASQTHGKLPVEMVDLRVGSNRSRLLMAVVFGLNQRCLSSFTFANIILIFPGPTPVAFVDFF